MTPHIDRSSMGPSSPAAGPSRTGVDPETGVDRDENPFLHKLVSAAHFPNSSAVPDEANNFIAQTLTSEVPSPARKRKNRKGKEVDFVPPITDLPSNRVSTRHQRGAATVAAVSEMPSVPNDDVDHPVEPPRKKTRYAEPVLPKPAPKRSATSAKKKVTPAKAKFPHTPFASRPEPISPSPAPRRRLLPQPTPRTPGSWVDTPTVPDPRFSDFGGDQGLPGSTPMASRVSGFPSDFSTAQTRPSSPALDRENAAALLEVMRRQFAKVDKEERLRLEQQVRGMVSQEPETVEQSRPRRAPVRAIQSDAGLSEAEPLWFPGRPAERDGHYVTMPNNGTRTVLIVTMRSPFWESQISRAV